MTEAVHIFPFSLMNPDTNKTQCAIWSVIKSFINIEFKELSGENINLLTNVIHPRCTIFWTAPHSEAVPGEINTYEIMKAHHHVLDGIVDNGTQVTFPPTQRRSHFLIPATSLYMLHMAGMAEHFDDILRKYKNIRVLSDESGVEYLDMLLRITQR